MGPSLRKRLSKRTSEATEVKSSSAADTAPPLLAAINHLQPPASTSKENLNTTPPPPDLMPPRTPDNVFDSPAASLLERYRERTPVAKAPAMPSPSEVLSMARSKIPAFAADELNDTKDLPPHPTEPPPGITTATSPVKSTIRTVSGVDFQMINANEAPVDLLQTRSNSAEPARAGVSDGEDDSLQGGQRRRLTRWQGKKEDRSDSTVGDIGNESLTAKSDAAVAVDADGHRNSDNDNKNSPSAESETLPARPGLKKKPSDQSTPTKTRPRISRFTRHSTTDRKKKEAETPSPTPKTPTPPPAAADNPNPRNTTSSSSSSTSSVNIIPSSTTRQTDLPNPVPRAENPDPIDPLPTTRVIPPAVAFHDQVLPGLLWASPLSATSRPALPWTWCKRWTCCRCAAGTIVEQGVCSRLACGHRRCEGRCVVAEGRRGGGGGL